MNYSQTLLAEYAYVLRPGGIIYTITDVEELHLWMVKHLDAFPLFARISDQDLVGDVVVEQVRDIAWKRRAETSDTSNQVRTSTEEGKKVERNKGAKYLACYRRLDGPSR